MRPGGSVSGREKRGLSWRPVREAPAAHPLGGEIAKRLSTVFAIPYSQRGAGKELKEQENPPRYPIKRLVVEERQGYVGAPPDSPTDARSLADGCLDTISSAGRSFQEKVITEQVHAGESSLFRTLPK